MARQPLHTDDIKIEQKAALIGNDVTSHDGEVVVAQQVGRVSVRRLVKRDREQSR